MLRVGLCQTRTPATQAAALQQCPFPVIDARHDLPADLGLRAKALIDDPARLKVVAELAHRIVDGKGPERIVEALFGKMFDA